ncbi:MAG: hypothetical protein BWX86_02225 [Verrucomicrobia bacterium ADurb.Bin122]|nr:MAG: hypothetical protein BWX86_02225 [Verrucomicrobia bacterium ADurb.Bin122]
MLGLKLKQCKRQTNLVVHVPLCCEHGEALTEHCCDHVFGRGLARAARYTHYARPHEAPMPAGQLGESPSGIIHNDQAKLSRQVAREVGWPGFRHYSPARTGRRRPGHEVMAIDALTRQREKERSGATSPAVNRGRRDSRVGRTCRQLAMDCTRYLRQSVVKHPGPAPSKHPSPLAHRRTRWCGRRKSDMSHGPCPPRVPSRPGARARSPRGWRWLGPR